MTYAKVGVHGRSEVLTLPHDTQEPRLGGGQRVTLGWALEGGQGGFGGGQVPAVHCSKCDLSVQCQCRLEPV